MRQRSLLTAFGWLCLIGFALFAANLADAETKPNPFAVPGTAPGVAQAAPPLAFGGPAGFTPPMPAAFGGVFGWVVTTQQNLQRQLATAVKSLKGDHAVTGAAMLAALSFFYGVVHAVGPGHGKAIISSYVVANEQTVRRGIIISFIASALQAVTAIALVGVLAIALNATGLQINAWSNQLETVSYALIALVGFWLLTNQLWRIFRRWREASAEPANHRDAHAHDRHAHGHDHHDHHHDHTGHDHGHGHHHAHAHANGEACDHIIDAKELAGPLSWRKILAVVISVGVRPCTGAILVLIFALTQGLFWAGVAATFAMAFGTALTVAALASLALGSRQLALRLGGENSAWANGVWTACTLGGSAVILIFGLTLFAASLGPARPF